MRGSQWMLAVVLLFSCVCLMHNGEGKAAQEETKYFSQLIWDPKNESENATSCRDNYTSSVHVLPLHQCLVTSILSSIYAESCSDGEGLRVRHYLGMDCDTPATNISYAVDVCFENNLAGPNVTEFVKTVCGNRGSQQRSTDDVGKKTPSRRSALHHVRLPIV